MELINEIYTGADKKESLYDLVLPAKWNKRIIVFIHGYMGYKDWGCWNLVQDFFLDKGYGFLKYNASHNGCTLDAPTEFKDLHAFAMNNYSKEVRDFEAITNVIQEKFPDIPDVFLIGHSRGGGIALLQSDYGMVSGISAWAPISSIKKRFPKGEELKRWKEDEFFLRENGRTKQKLPHDYSQFEDFLKHQQRLNIESYCRNSILPTLVIHGENDQSVSIVEGRSIANWTHTDLVVIPNTQHTFDSSEPWEKDVLPPALEEVCQKTLSFFNSIPAKKEQVAHQKRSLLSQLIELAKSDKELRDAEFRFLLTISKQLGITKEEFLKLFEEKISLIPPKLESERILQLQRLILLMNVDEDIQPSELEYIKEIGVRLGLNPLAINAVLLKMKEYPNYMIPPEELLSIFSTYHN